MYRRKSTIVTLNSLRTLTKVCINHPKSSLHLFKKVRVCTNFSTAYQIPYYYNSRNELNGEDGINNLYQNQYGCVDVNRVYGENPCNQFQYHQNGNFGTGYIENGPRIEFLGNPGGENGRLEVGFVDHNQKNGSFGVYNGYGFASSWNGSQQYGEVNGGFNQIWNGVYSGGIGNNGSLHQRWDGGNYGMNYGNYQYSGVIHGDLQQSWNAGYYGVIPGNLQRSWNAGYSGLWASNLKQSWNAGYSGVSPSNLQQSWNVGYSGDNPGNSQQSWSAGYSGENPGNSQQSWNVDNSGVSSSNLQQSWNAGYSGDNPGNLQQSWNADNSGGSSGNLQHSWGVGYSDGSNEHLSQNWNEHYTQNAGMHQETSHDYYAGNGVTLQFPQGNQSSGNPGIYHGNTIFSNNDGNAGEFRQITGGSHQSDAGFVQQTSNQCERGSVDTLGESSVKPNEESEVVVEDQLKGTLEELDKLYQEHMLKEVVDVLGLLEEQHISVDLPMYLLLFKACGEEKALEEGKSIHEHLVRSGLDLEVKIHNKILEMYCSCGSWDDAFKFFDKMPIRNLTTWDTMISWLAKNGDGEDALALFTEFKETGLKPDGTMFLGIFSACGVVGDTVEGLLHFESMIKDYSIVPSMDHYIGVVDMLGAAGNLDEASEFIEKMPLEPSVEVWEVLMNLCRIHGNLELGNRCAELVEALDPSRLDEQSRAGYLPLKPSDTAKDKEKNKSVLRFPGSRSRVHEYRAGDRSQPELYDLLRGMKQQLKEAGYIPEVKFVLHDIDPEAKEEALMAHSERLAVAQGLLTTPARYPIRIIKNLRICVDCHNTMKIVSKLVGRELIIRDAKRFHHFKDGLCSCRDYW